MRRRLDSYDVLVRRNEAVSILDKVRAFRIRGKPEATMDVKVSSDKPFGLRTNYHGAESSKGLKRPIKFYGSRRISWIERDSIQQNDEWIDQWKVLMSRVQGTSAAVETMFLSKPIISGPREACSETYIVAGHFDSRLQAERCAAYLETRFVRFLVSLRKSTQHAGRGVYAFVPDVPMGRKWTDSALYKRYGLNANEIAFIESIVRPMGTKEEDEASEEEADE